MSLNMTPDNIPYNNYDDYTKGREALIFFHNAMVRFYPQTYKISLQELLTGLTKRTGQKFFIEGLGLSIINTDISMKSVNESMTTFASNTGGKIPASNGAFYNVIQGAAVNGNWIDMATFVSVGVAKDVVIGIGDTVLNVGEAAVDTSTSLIGSLKWVVPVILIGGAFIYVYASAPKRS